VKKTSLLPAFSKRSRLTLAIAFILTAISFTSRAQDRCGTVEYSEKLQSEKKVNETTRQFEEWLKTRQLKRAKDNETHREQTATYQVPVVVHIIHNGEAEGTGTNISEAQVLSQISVLNNDYKRLNADAINTPAMFTSVAGAFDVEFVLAKRDPEGLATSGIVRAQGSQTSWTINDNYELKETSYWPSEDYLNIWVCNITDYLGYAQFPVSGLPGLENSSTNALTDGVVIAYRAFGSSDDGTFDLDPDYNKGRTATHEIGHFFGLRHIWGDDAGACGGSGDYVSDTPDQSSSTSGCLTSRTTCSNSNMVMNYMDYTDDECMNLFTENQVDRMITVIENSVRRASLLTSHALEDPITVADDGGVKSIVIPSLTQCSGNITPTVEIKNYGNNTITSLRIRLRVNGVIVETKDFTVNLNPLESTTLTFTNRNIGTGSVTVQFEIIQTNGSTDNGTYNSTKSIQAFVPLAIAAPFSELFNSTPSSWRVQNPDGLIAWANATAPNASPSNKAMYMNFYDYEDAEGEIDILITPSIDLSAAPAAQLNFNVAYARYQSSNDGLRVYVLTDCNQNIYDGTLIYNKSGSALSTASSTTSVFVPEDASEWRTESVSLYNFIGNSNVQLAFVGYNDFGNNVYIDNVGVSTNQIEDLILVSVNPGMATCDTEPEFTLTVTNNGSTPITSFDINFTINQEQLTEPFIGSIPPGQTVSITIPPVMLENGINDVSFELLNPNGLTDPNPSDNTKSFSIVVNSSEKQIPFTENFENPFEADWISLNPAGGMRWKAVTAPSFGRSIFFNAYNNSVPGDEAWLISPTIDLSKEENTSLQFYTSYANRGEFSETLRVLYSLDCGGTFETLPLFSRTGDMLASTTSDEPWKPETINDWKHHVIDLDQFAENESVRFAFVVTNDGGNNLYVDNISFVGEDDLYKIYDAGDSYDFYIQLNLPESQTISYEVVDIMGRQLVRGEIANALNQTWPVSLHQSTSSGIYIVRLGIRGEYHASKIYLSR
jgi:archaellum component FlaF (FlaF/FlaG flagellin family)